MFDRTFGGVLRWLITALSQRRGDFGSGAVPVFALALLPRSRRASGRDESAFSTAAAS
jgi:hypothetical protein